MIGTVGAWVIYALIWLFGRTHEKSAVGWLVGPMGGDVIGDAPYRDVAAAEGLTVERHASDGGLVPDFRALDGAAFDADKTHPLVREFYEHTTAFAMDVWSRTYFPASLVLWLLTPRAGWSARSSHSVAPTAASATPAGSARSPTAIASCTPAST